MAPATSAQRDDGSQRTLSKHELPADKAKYIVTKPEMEEFLKRTFGARGDFDVSVCMEDGWNKDPVRGGRRRIGRTDG